MLQEDPLVEYLHCPICRGCSTSRMPTPSYLSGYYSGYYGADEKEVTFPSSIRRFAKHILESTPIDLSGSRLNILDYGGGDGTIAKEIAAIILAKRPILKVSILVVDYLKPEPFRQGGIELKSVERIEDVKDEGFDLIIASAILEHIPDLHTTLPNLFRICARGGLVYIRVPYVLPLKKWFPNVPMLWPMHVHDLGPSFWNRLPERGVLQGEIVLSRPPLSETEFRHHFLLTLFSHLMKLPAKAELSLRHNPKDMFWKYVAGWEVVYRIRQ